MVRNASSSDILTFWKTVKQDGSTADDPLFIFIQNDNIFETVAY